MDEHACRWCDLLPPFVRAVRSVCWMPGGTSAAIVHALKYDGWRAVADGMAARIARLAWPHDVLEERAAVIPVPLARGRERERGYNQSALIASALATRWRIPIAGDVLARARETTSQTRLTPGERLRNVAGAFETPDAVPDRLRGAHVVLVDDVVTTAATLNACAGVLVAAGVRIVSYATFGRALAMGDRPIQ
jgi:ComF family protein